MGVLVVRAVVFELEALAEASSTSAGLAEWLGSRGAVSVKLSVQRASRLGLLVQRPPGALAAPTWEPTLRIARVGGLRYCRYHEGFGESVEYCTEPASTAAGYCHDHARSWRALYEQCSQGVDSACEEAERAAPPEEFAVYALDYGGGVKVGLTQLWRLPHRVAEQPHVSAALVAKGRLTEMRGLERALGRRHAATEGMGVRVSERMRRATGLLERVSTRELATRLASLLSELGLEGEYEALTILPRSLKPRDFAEAEPQSPLSLAGRELKLVDYWAGLLALEDLRSGELVFVRKRDLLHVAVAGEVSPFAG